MTNLKELIRVSSVEEAKLEAWLKRSRQGNKFSMGGGYQKPVTVPSPKLAHSSGSNHVTIPANQLELSRSLPIRGLTREQMAEKRIKGLCFACDEPYTFGHQCKKPQLFMLLPSEECEEVKEVDYCEVEISEVTNDDEKQEAHIM